MALALTSWDPLRLAEEITMLDPLSRGWFIPGIGRGYRHQCPIALLSDMTAGDAIVTPRCRTTSVQAMQHYQVRRSRSLQFRFGTMGFGLPAAIGAQVGCSDRLVIDIDGDGSLNMTIHEFSACHRYGFGGKVVVINNQWLGMVRQWQYMIYRGTARSQQLGGTCEHGSIWSRTRFYVNFETMLTFGFSSSLDQKTRAALAAPRWRSAITAGSCRGEVRRWCPGRSCETRYSLN